MAAVTLLGSATFNTTSGTKTVTATPAVDDLIVIVTAHSGNTSSNAPTDDQGGTYALINSAVKASSADTMRVWVRRTKVTAASSTVFTHAPGTSSGGGLAVLKVTGMQRVGAAAVRQSAIQSNQAGGGTPTPVFGVAALTGNALIGAVFNAASPAGLTPRSSPAYSERADVGYSTPTTGLEVMSIDSGETATSIAWGGTSASAFGSLVVELDNSNADPLEDGDWWAGTYRCAAGVAIAGAAAALTLCSGIAHGLQQQTEDIGPPPATVLGATIVLPTQRAQHLTAFTRWAQVDELPAPAVPTALDDGSAWQPPPPQASAVRLLGPAWDDQALSWEVDEAYWWQPPWPATVTVRPLVLPDVEFAPQAAPSPAVDDEPWQPPRPTAAPLWTHAWQADEPIVPQPASDQSGAGGGLPFYGQRAEHEPRYVRWYQADELPAAPVALPVDEQHAWPPPQPLPAPVLRLWATDDPLPTVAQPLEEQYAWQPPTPQRAPVASAWAADDPLPPAPAFAPVDEPAPELVHAPGPVTAILWAEDEPIVPQPVALPVDDTPYWRAPPPPPPAPLVRLWHQQDEVVTAAAPLQVDSDAWWPLPRVQPAPVHQLWSVDDVLAQAAAPVDLDPAPLVPALPQRLPPHVFIGADDVVPAAAALAPPDDGASIELRTVLRAPVLQLWHQQDELGTPPAIAPFDDAAWQPPAPARPAVPVMALWWHQDELGDQGPVVVTVDGPNRIGATAVRDATERVGLRGLFDATERIGGSPLKRRNPRIG